MRGGGPLAGVGERQRPTAIALDGRGGGGLDRRSRKLALPTIRKIAAITPQSRRTVDGYTANKVTDNSPELLGYELTATPIGACGVQN